MIDGSDIWQCHAIVWIGEYIVVGGSGNVQATFEHSAIPRYSAFAQFGIDWVGAALRHPSLVDSGLPREQKDSPQH
jgi:hypothetical protein